MSADLVVVGAGVAGTAAAWAAASSGAKVTVIHERAGSSALYSGVLDDIGTSAESSGTREFDADARAFVVALGLWKLGPRLVATREGLLRQSKGSDTALLDLEPLAGGHVAVADPSRDDWDAPLLAAAFSKSPWAERTGTRFSCVPVDALRRGHERRITSHDFAALHDDPERLGALSKLLLSAGAGFDGWLLGPWLGVVPGTAERLRSWFSLPVGESTSAIGGASGARFEHARDALFRRHSVNVVRARLTAVEARGERWLACFEGSGEGDADELEAKAVVLATGGVAAGGVAFVAEPEHGVHGFRLPFRAPVALALDGEPGGSGGSLYGPSLEVRGLGVLERVGVHASASGEALDGSAPLERFGVAGDALAGRPRTVLEAVRSGIAAARSIHRSR